MPAIKLKKAAAEHQAEKEREERERESEVPSTTPPKPKETQPGGSLLRGLDTNILFEKRKRPAHPSEQKLIDWMETNLESKEECHVNLNSLYDYFGEACSFDGTAVMDQLLFNKRIVEKFGKHFALKESSPYKGLIKEKKATKTVKGDTLKIKMKDIIEEAIKDAGNPVKGVRFFALKQYIACNYPALRVDLRPAYLKAALERGVRYGHIQLVKGVGLAGFYRLPVDEEPDETEDKSASKEGEEKPSEQHGPEEQNGDAEVTEDKPEDEAAAVGAKPKKKSRKRKATEEKEAEEGEKAEGEGGEDGEPKKKKKKKKQRRRRPRPDSYHAAPQKIEDTFALAMTYMCEPKQTSFGKIKKYIAEHYPHVDVESELKPKMESGEKKGYWEHVTGQGLAGTFRLMIDEFDPNSTDNIEDMICSAIIACNEPKQASSNLLKRYVMEYHPEFNVESRPHLFKMALERALKKQMIIQLSGIGASGSFQMWSVFSPSPALLAGEDVSDDEDILDIKEEAYVPRGTKSRRQTVRKNPLEKVAESRPKPHRRPAPSSRSERTASRPRPKSAKSSSRGKGKVSYTEKNEDDEEEMDEDEEEPAPKKARKAGKSGKAKKGKGPGRASPKKKGPKPLSRSQLAEEVGGDEEAQPKKSRKSKPVEEEEDEEEASTPVKSSRGRSRSRPNYAEGKGDSDDDDEPKAGRGKKSPGSRRASKSISYSEKDDDDYEDEPEEDKTEYTPRKSKSRGGEEEVEKVETSPSPKKKGKKRR